MRTLTGHLVNPVNEQLTITVMDEPGAGGASHRYAIRGFDAAKNPSGINEFGFEEDNKECVILFQNGTIPERGVNGITQEALLTIVADRLRSFQAGPFACAENAVALNHVEIALATLKDRTKARMNRGVEGTHTP